MKENFSNRKKEQNHLNQNNKNYLILNKKSLFQKKKKITTSINNTKFLIKQKKFNFNNKKISDSLIKLKKKIRFKIFYSLKLKIIKNL